ncbi:MULTISPECIES: transglutaminase family protein [Acidithiobacillus]|nr:MULTISPECIES: transglutaminaseTgpA domain-containing protein [Acidithiobacillus]
MRVRPDGRGRITPALVAGIALVLFLAIGSDALQWPLLLWLPATLWSLWAGPSERPFPLSGRLRFVALLSLMLVAVAVAGLGNWLVMASQILILALTFKALELRELRDVYQVAALVLLGLGIAAWLRVDLSLGLYLLLEVLLVPLALLWQGYWDACRGQLARVVGSSREQLVPLRRLVLFDLGFMFLLLPVLALFFLLLPRTPTPLWHWGAAAGTAVSGFQARLDPRDIRELSLDPAVAFRARIQGAVPPPAELYWQGAILWRDDGGANWSRGLPPRSDFAGVQQADPRLGGASWRETILLSSGEHEFLFSLGQMQSVQSSRPVERLPDGAWRLREPSHEPLRYEALASPDTGASTLPDSLRKVALQLPARVDPQVLALARRLRGADAGASVAHILHWFATADFRYSLKAPAAYPHGQSLSDFLLRTHEGYCEYYAAGLALLLRLDGVPARVVVGYRGGEYNPVGAFWVVRQNMAHAWVQAWLPGRGWVRLDATPAAPSGTTAGAAAAGRDRALSGTDSLWNWLQWQWLNWVIQLTPAKQRSLWSAGGSVLQGLAHWQTPKLRKMPTLWQHGGHDTLRALGLLTVAGMVLILALVWRRIGRRGVEFWQQRARRRLARAGFGDSRPGTEFVALAQRSIPAPQRQALVELIRRQRYGPRADRAGDLALKRGLRAIRRHPSADPQ